jgi:hypothetical protein
LPLPRSRPETNIGVANLSVGTLPPTALCTFQLQDFHHDLYG